jgi:hypothetical protein
MRVDAIRHSAPVCAVARALFWCVDIGVDLIATGTDLFGRDGCLRLVEIRRTLLEEGRKRFLGFSRAHALTELLHFEFDGGFDLVDKAVLEEPLAGLQCGARFSASFCAVSIAVANKFGSGTTRVTSPSSAARAAVKGSPSRYNSAARRYPMRAGSEELDPNSGTSARLMNGSWNLALSPA